ncbi:MAG: SH3 domain-containing protein [Clostridium sp.]
MKKKKVVALVLAASTSATVVLAKNAIVSHADTLNGLKNNIKNENVSSIKGKVINIKSNLRVRQGDSISTPVIGYLQNGDIVNIQGESKGFYKISLNGKIGYVYSEYIENLNKNNSKNISDSTGTVINIKSNLRFRSGATTNSNVLGYFVDGQKVNVVGQANGWTKINYEGQEGYVDSSYIKIGNSESGNEVVNENNDNTISMKALGGVVNVETNLRIRSGATTNSSIIGRLYEGDRVKIVGKDGDWYKIQTTNGTGFVCGDYIQILNGQDNGNTDNKENIDGNGTVINVSSNLRIRTAPSLNSSVTGYLLNGQNVKVTGKEGTWYRINQNGQTGYVDSSFISVNGKINDIHRHSNQGISYSNKYGEVININSSLRVRRDDSLNSSVIGYLLNGQGIKVLGKTGNWYKIGFNGQIGYTSANYIKLVDHLDESTSNSGASFERLYSILKNQIGSPYLWGAEGGYITTASLNSLKREFPDVARDGRYNIPAKYINHGYRGFDCSGLLDWAFSQMGINIGRTTYQQVSAGRAVSLQNVRPGDLLFFKGPVHVGLYIGNGKWIVAPESHAYVRIENVPWNKIACARRVLP